MASVTGVSASSGFRISSSLATVAASIARPLPKKPPSRPAPRPLSPCPATAAPCWAGGGDAGGGPCSDAVAPKAIHAPAPIHNERTSRGVRNDGVSENMGILLKDVGPAPPRPCRLVEPQRLFPLLELVDVDAGNLRERVEVVEVPMAGPVGNDGIAFLL